jgi:dienelactone hydrolase
MEEPSGRISARSVGRNPAWEEEDLLRVTAGANIGYTDRILQVNPLGAYSLEKAVPGTRWVDSVFPYSDEREAAVVYQNIEKFLVAARVSEKQWTVEAAFPLSELSAPGPDKVYVLVERLRARRPGAPIARWRWPSQGPAAKVAVRSDVKWEDPPPQFKPVFTGNPEAPIEVGRVTSLPPLEAAWDAGPWHDARSWQLLRNELPAWLPRVRSEVKLLHDGRTLAVMVRCAEPENIEARVRDHDGRVDQDDSFHVYLTTSGSMYAQVVTNTLGYLLDAAGFSGGPRISRQREWSSGARVHIERHSGTWTARLDIPLEGVARVLGESGMPDEWRILLMRYRRGRKGEAAERSVLPVVQSETALCPARYRRLRLMDAAPSAILAAHEEKPAETPDYAFVLTSDERREMGLAGMVERTQRQRALAILEVDRRDWERVKSRADWERFRDARLNALRKWLGEFPQREPLQASVTKEFRGHGYRRQDLVYRSRPDLWVTANLYLPEKPPERMPGIVIIHSHHRPRTQAELQDMGILWARAGSAVLIMDQIGHGERIQTYPWNREGYYARYATGVQLYVAGESLMKWMAWDIMRGVDLLLERKDIDQGKIVLLGAVAGGGDPAAVVAALDPRIAAVAPFNFGEASPELGAGNTDWPKGLADPGWGSWETTRNLPRSIIDRYLPWTIVASVAPRRLIFSFEMGWEVEKVPAWERYRKVFSLYDALDRLDEAHGFGEFPGPGECANIGPSQRKTLYPELLRWFGIPAPATEPDDRRPEEELAALTEEVAGKLGMRMVHELVHDIAKKKVEAARQQMVKLDAPGLRKWLQERCAAKLGETEPNRQAKAVSRWKKHVANAEVEGLTLEAEPGIVVPFLLLRSNGALGSRLPLVTVVSQGGKESILARHQREIDRLLEGGLAVCLPDVRGVGETAPDLRSIPLSAGIDDGAAELMLGRTMIGARLKDLRSVLAYAASRPDIDPERLAVWGDSDAQPNPPRVLLEEMAGWRLSPQIQQQAEPLGGLLALLAGLYEDNVKVVAVRRGLTGYLSILEDNFPYVPSDVIVPGSAEAGDLSDIAAALAPRPVLLTEMVDGKNRMQGEATGQTATAEWLVKNLQSQ